MTTATTPAHLRRRRGPASEVLDLPLKLGGKGRGRGGFGQSRAKGGGIEQQNGLDGEGERRSLRDGVGRASRTAREAVTDPKLERAEAVEMEALIRLSGELDIYVPIAAVDQERVAGRTHSTVWSG